MLLHSASEEHLELEVQPAVDRRLFLYMLNELGLNGENVYAVTICVTFHREALTGENRNEKLLRPGADSSTDESEYLDLFTDRP